MGREHSVASAIFYLSFELDCIAQYSAGSQGYEEVDAQTYAEWGIDLLKYDNCMGSHTSAPEHGYPIMRDGTLHHHHLRADIHARN